MTVKELIQKLYECPPDKIVTIQAKISSCEVWNVCEYEDEVVIE